MKPPLLRRIAGDDIAFAKVVDRELYRVGYTPAVQLEPLDWWQTACRCVVSSGYEACAALRSFDALERTRLAGVSPYAAVGALFPERRSAR